MGSYYIGVVFRTVRVDAISVFKELPSDPGLRLCQFTATCFGIYPVYAEDDEAWAGLRPGLQNSDADPLWKIAETISSRYTASLLVDCHSTGGGSVKIFVNGAMHAQRDEDDEKHWFEWPRNRRQNFRRDERIPRSTPLQYIDEHGKPLPEPRRLRFIASPHDYLPTALQVIGLSPVPDTNFEDAFLHQSTGWIAQTDNLPGSETTAGTR